MTIRTQGGAVYSIAYRDLDGSGDRLAIRRQGGPDDPPETNKPMLPDRWYRVAMLTPLPPEIATTISMVLDPIEGDEAPVVRKSTMGVSTATIEAVQQSGARVAVAGGAIYGAPDVGAAAAALKAAIV